MIALLYAFYFVVFGSILGLLLLAWWVGRERKKLPVGETLDLRFRVPFLLSVALLFVYTALGHGSAFNDFEINSLDRLWMAGLGLPLLMIVLAIAEWSVCERHQSRDQKIGEMRCLSAWGQYSPRGVRNAE
ncbi:hypothetical protein J7382_02710 [Shimia sp. R11_0]|uniref:hypothetical protein n=1 Tax=Shimia sp. R11_0 TaxID=2821096 RepID=UPI001ADC6212|nr:hypothetical protein [Shimia sp. R11_0]MBO9476436.1 hypothetical protein [Shimia sp. R11_0]